MPWEAQDATYWSITDPRVDNNALLIGDILYDNNYDPKAIAAVLGNAMHEGTMNPWLWEMGTPTYSEFMNDQAAFNARGYGLYQYTNPNKYINSNNSSLPGYAPHFSDDPGDPSDGEAQTIFLVSYLPTDWTDNQLGYYEPEFQAQQIPKDIREFYPTTVQDFIDGNASGSTDEEIIENLTGAFELQFERPRADRAASTYQMRVNDAIHFYDLIQSYGLGGKGRFNIMYYIKPYWKRRIF